MSDERASVQRLFHQWISATRCRCIFGAWPTDTSTIKSTDMQELLSDLTLFVRKHWKTILAIAVVIYLLSSYSDIKQGIVDGWSDSRDVR
jgi:hypothetical protein